MSATVTPREPLYKLQRRALDDGLAAAEVADRYAEEVARGTSIRHRVRVAHHYLSGLRGELNPTHGYRSNFQAPLRKAWLAGRRLRTELLDLEQLPRVRPSPEVPPSPEEVANARNMLDRIQAYSRYTASRGPVSVDTDMAIRVAFREGWEACLRNERAKRSGEVSRG